MSISISEPVHLTCPDCGARLNPTVWVLIDAAERPDLASELHAGTLNLVTCSQCGQICPAGAPLLFHDPIARRVYFAAPAGNPEHLLREQARSLLYHLAEHLPDAQQLAYLSDVQIEQEIEGVRRAILRRARRTAQATAAPTRSAGSARAAQTAAAIASDSTLLEQLSELLAADTPVEFRSVAQRYPELSGQRASELLETLARNATANREVDVSRAIREAQIALRRIARAPTEAEQRPDAATTPQTGAIALSTTPAQLSDAAYYALMRCESPADLLAAVRAHPELLESWSDQALTARTEMTLESGNERLAQLIEERRETLATQREALTGAQALLHAWELLLRAEDAAAITQLLHEYPALLTDAAQTLLRQIAEDASAHGDDERAAEAAEYRTMLRQVRAGRT